MLVYLANPASPFHIVATNAVLKIVGRGDNLRTCPQSLIEFRVVATRPASSPSGLGLSLTDAAQNTARFLTIFPLLADNPAIFPFWRNLVETHGVIGKPNHDARFVATAAIHGCTGILTFNIGDFARYAAAMPSVAIVAPNTL